MSRSATLVGLNKRAVNWLNKYCKVRDYTQETVRKYTDGTPDYVFTHQGKEIVSEDSDRIIYGLSDEEMTTMKIYPLLNDNGSVEEFVQCEPWSGGPVIYLALRFTDTKKPIRVSLWSDRETGSI